MVDQTLLKEWDLEKFVEKIRETRFRYTYDLGAIDFVFLKEHDFFRIHKEIWCEHKTEVFLAIFENGEIHICDAKTKPHKPHSIEAIIDSFNYGDNTLKARKYSHLFKRENIESGECIKEIQSLLKKRKKPRVTVDEDLTKTMELCRNKITALVKKDEEGIAQKIVDRCLFIRILEEKTGRNDLKSVLNRKKFDELLDLFDFYSGISDIIFEKGDIPRDITDEVMGELQYMFGDVDTPDCCRVLYSFKDIPVSVITTVYEKFLSKEEKRILISDNVVEYITDKILEESYIADKINEGKIKILDLACGSGAFLVTFLEKIIRKREKNRKLSLKEKACILGSIYGIDKSNDAIRTTALCLYLKIIEDEPPEIIKELFKDKNFFSELKTKLLHGNPCDNLFHGEKFDIIVGNPLQNHPFSEEKRINNQNTAHQSQLLLHIEKWMEKGALCGIVAPLLWFTQRKYEKFRKDFMEKYSLKSFTNLSRLGIAYKGGEPACTVFFTNTPDAMITFCTPARSYFSEVTGIISDNGTCEVPAVTMKEHENLWHIYALGYHEYKRSLTYVDRNKCNYFEDFLEMEQPIPYMCREDVTKTYKAPSKVAEDYTADLDSRLPYLGKEKQEYTYERAEPDDTDSLKRKLIVPKTWPINAFIDSVAHDANSWSYTLNHNYPEEYLLLFKAILNSRFAHFYLEVKYRLGEEDYPGIRLQHISHFPVPDLEFNCDIVNKIVKIVKSLKSLDSCGSHYKKLQNDLDTLIFILYDLDYYDRKEIEQYYIEKEKDTIVTEEDIQKYCEEFIDTFNPFIKEEFFLNPEWGTSEFFGTMVRFSVSEEEKPLQYNKELERFFHIIENQKIEYEKKDIFKEKKIKFYDNNELYIYKSNKFKDWTEFMAIKDANEELHEHFRRLEG